MNPKTGILLADGHAGIHSHVRLREGPGRGDTRRRSRLLPGIFALIPLCLWFIASSERITVPAAKNIGSLLAGSSAGLGGMFFGFLALAYLPLVNVTVLSYTTPLFTIMLAALLLGEKVRIYRWSAVLTGFIGVFITLAETDLRCRLRPRSNRQRRDDRNRTGADRCALRGLFLHRRPPSE